MSKGEKKVQTLFAKEVSTHPTMVSTQHLSIKGKKIPGFCLLRSTHSQGRSTLDSAPRTACLQIWDSRSTQHQSRSTLDSVPRTTFSQVWDSVSTPPPGQVDTLRKDSILRWMFATCQPRAMGYQPRIVCPCTQRVSLESFGYKRSLIGPPSHQETQLTLRASQKFPGGYKRSSPSSALRVLPEDQFSPIQKPLKHPKEADPVEAFVGEEFKEDPTIPKCRASVLDFKIASLFPIQASTREYT
ncbi:hypothetical protein Taro_001797 [Colocasia esculenta]|uniref:Uncharacterized protein n=1 Tax=Colocasia esculenta TaxID=4460 RepID=A0A843TEM8_COLES|nr:hypothetical protein [Colocasia esculenta]